MTTIHQMLTNILVGGGKGESRTAISPSLKAYCLDGDDFKGDKNKDLRHITGVNGCHCCDYFCPMDNHVMLIEEKQLCAKRESLKIDYGTSTNEKIIDEFITYNLRLKLYGSLLVLCRLQSQCATVESMVKDKPYKFYIIASDDDIKGVESLQDKLSGKIKGGLKIVDVIFCNPDGFQTIFKCLP